jgi:carboxyl-terminal processing protease
MMESRNGWLAKLAFTLLLAGLPFTATARAQVLVPAEISEVSSGASEDVARVVEQGARLEQQRRWADALNYYEDALRAHPGQTELRQRLDLARSHYDVVRRYGDSSFAQSLTTLSERDALNVFNEVLLKIHSHYVHLPKWQAIVARGTQNLEVALSEPAFIDRNLGSIAPTSLAQLQQEVRKLGQLSVDDRQQAQDYVWQVASKLKQQYGLPAQAVILEYTSGATGGLDDYSGFLTGSQMDEVFSQIEGNFVGLGVELKTEPAGLLIMNVIAGGPAEQGGIRAGDRITTVDGHTTTDSTPDSLADLLRGTEGSKVDLIVRDEQQQNRTLHLTRQRVEVPCVDDVKIIDKDNGIGYFKLTSFQKSTSRDVDAALWKLHAEGMRTLIIDLRGNPGGLLKAAVDVADKFVGEGLIVATRGRSARDDFDHRGQTAGTWRVPLVVLVNHDSASASEILAGAIRDHHRGTVVGETSYGKGSVQGIFPLNVGTAGVRLTTAKWYTPSGQAISGQGITPDVQVRVVRKPSTSIATDDGQDDILNAGLQVFRNQVSRRSTP